MSIQGLTASAATSCLCLFACGATSTTAGDGGTAGLYTAQAEVSGLVQAGSETGVNDASKCAAPAPLSFVLGSPGQPARDNTGTGGTVSMFCSVIPGDDGGFDINLHAASDQGGFSMAGRVLDGPNNSVFGSIGTNAGGGAATVWWDDPNCVFATTTHASPGVSGGRIWGTLTCARAAGEQTSRVCAATAEVRFENCFDHH